MPYSIYFTLSNQGLDRFLVFGRSLFLSVMNENCYGGSNQVTYSIETLYAIVF